MTKAVWFVWLLFIGSATVGANSPVYAQTMHVQPVDVMDSSGFKQPVRAFTIFLPQGWQHQGGVIWTLQDSCNPYGFNFAWEASSADRRYGVAILPTLRWASQSSEFRRCPQLSFRSAQEFLSWLVQNQRPDARLLEYRPRPDLIRELGLVAGRTPLPGGEMVMAADAGELLFGFVEHGVEKRATVMTGIQTWVSRVFPAYGLPGIEITGGSSMPAWLVHAPDGELDLRASELLRKSIRSDPQWTQAISQHIAKIDRENANSAMVIADINRRGNEEVSDIIHNGWRTRREIQDRGHRETIEAIRGVETYNDPINGGTIELDNSFAHAWQLDDGSFVLTDDPSFQPGQNLGLNGQRLTVVP